MKKLLLAILVFFGLKTSAQIMPCDSISYGTSSTINYPLVLSGSISFIPDSISWTWSVCDDNMCYSGNGVNATFGLQMAGLADPQKMAAMKKRFVDHIMDNMNTVFVNFRI